MAKIVKPAAKTQPSWMESGEEFVVIALDQNEALAVRNAVREYHRKTVEARDMAATSINGSGARVFVALDPIVKPVR